MQRLKGSQVKDGKIVPTETDIRRQIQEYLGIYRIKVWRNVQGLGCFRGLPDLEGVYKRQHFYIEVKSKKGKLSKYQVTFKEMVEQEGEPVMVCNSFERFMELWTRFKEVVDMR